MIFRLTTIETVSRMREEVFEERRVGAGDRRERRIQAVEQQPVVLADEQRGTR